VVWEDNRDGDYEIYYKQSVDAGLTWGADTRLTNSPGGSFDPCIAVSGSVVHVVWDDLRNATGTMDYEIYYKCSTDGGLSWGPDTRLTNNPSYCGYPCIVATGPVVQVVWEDDRDGNGEIYYKRSTDAGLTWGADTRLTNDLADSWDPCIVVNGSVMHLVWMDMRDGNYEVYYKRSEDGGISWGDDTRLTNASGESQYPNIAVSGPNVHLVWPDARDGNFEIYYKQSTDGGLTWGLDTRLTSAVNASQSPSVSASGSVVHAIWYDKRSGNNEIYYKRNPTGNTMVGFADNVANNSGPQSSIYPNPASGKTCIKFNQDFKGVALISVYNVLGERMIHRETMTSETIIDVSCLQKGVYFVGVTLDNKPIICNKLIVSGKQ
jgi:hypothetical protein